MFPFKILITLISCLGMIFAPVVHADQAADISKTTSPFADLVWQLPAWESDPIPVDGVYHSEHFVQMQNLGSDAMVCRVHLFRHVQKSLDILTYIWNEDFSGRFMMREAVKAAERGVKVRILVDTIGTPEDMAMLAYFSNAHPNLEFKVYNPVSHRVLPSKFHLYRELFFKFKKFNQRMHTKLILADDKIAITGGRNFGDEYYDVNDGHNFKDRDLLVVGPMLNEMRRYFEAFWNHGRSVPASELIDVKKGMKKWLPGLDPDKRFYDFDDMFDDVIQKAEDDAYIRRRFVNQAMRVHELMLVIDPPGKSKRLTGRNPGSRATHQLLSVVSKIEKSIVLQSPYFILNDRGIKMVRERRKNNPDLDMVMSTNSLAATDSLYAYTYAFKRQRTYVYDLGIRIFELKPIRMELYTLKYLENRDLSQIGYDPSLGQFGLRPNDYYGKENEHHMSIHAKSFVIDDKVAWIGSTNLDSRSLRWNTEIGVVIWDEKFTQALKKDILWDTLPMNSWTIAKKKKGLSFVRRAHEPIGILMSNIPAMDVWPFEYTSAFELKKGQKPVAMTDPAFYDRYEDVGSFPLVSPLAKRHWRLRMLKTMIGMIEPVL